MKHFLDRHSFVRLDKNKTDETTQFSTSKCGAGVLGVVTQLSTSECGLVLDVVTQLSTYEYGLGYWM